MITRCLIVLEPPRSEANETAANTIVIQRCPKLRVSAIRHADNPQRDHGADDRNYGEDGKQPLEERELG
jgi:hypothetical protein